LTELTERQNCEEDQFAVVVQNIHYQSMMGYFQDILVQSQKCCKSKKHQINFSETEQDAIEVS
jgi:hypothetical protein